MMDSRVLVDPPIRDRIGPKCGIDCPTNRAESTIAVLSNALFHVKSREKSDTFTHSRPLQSTLGFKSSNGKCYISEASCHEFLCITDAAKADGYSLLELKPKLICSWK